VPYQSRILRHFSPISVPQRHRQRLAGLQASRLFIAHVWLFGESLIMASLLSEDGSSLSLSRCTHINSFLVSLSTLYFTPLDIALYVQEYLSIHHQQRLFQAFQAPPSLSLSSATFEFCKRERQSEPRHTSVNFVRFKIQSAFVCFFSLRFKIQGASCASSLKEPNPSSLCALNFARSVFYVFQFQCFNT